MNLNNPMNPGMNPMRGYNNPMGYQNRGYNPQINQGYNPMNRHYNQNVDYRQQNYQNQYNPNRNMAYNPRQHRNPMFNPMNNPINTMNPIQNPMNFIQQQGQYPQMQNNTRYSYQEHGNNQGGYQQ